MKRIISLLMAIIFIAGCAACFRLDGGEHEANADPADTAAPTAEQTQAPTEGPTSEPVYSEAPTEAPTPAPTDAPTAAPTEEVIAVPTAELLTAAPTAELTPAPTAAPTNTPKPTAAPTNTPKPTAAPTRTPKPTAAPTPAAPAVTPMPTPAPAQTATPKPTETPSAGDDSIRFSESASLPLPSLNEDVPWGQPFTFGGIVKSDTPILSVTAEIVSSGGSRYSRSVEFDASDNKTSVELVDKTFPSSGNASLTAKVKFQDLAAGNYTFNLYARAVGTGNVILKSRQFKIVKNEWNQLISNNLRNNYAYALQFFGSRGEFMFKYKWKASTGRDIIIESDWDSKHLTSVVNPNGKKWYVHKKAAPYYNRAIEYLDTAYVHVGGTYDSGVIKLWSLVESFDGTVNHRFVSDRSFVSHHAFGTAIDLNASMDANVNKLANRTLIKEEVQNHLVYNGIKEKNGVRYYDFTYTGSHSSRYKNVPTTIINYLLYELAFYRAGFNWGYYYPHTCDAMHFGVSEMSSDIHNTSGRSLRKVFSYIG